MSGPVVTVLSEKVWLKIEADYVLRHEGQFTLPHGGFRRCGHRHTTREHAANCARALANRVWRESW